MENQSKTSEPGRRRAEIEELIWGELRQCFDPEIPLNIVDLGLVYDVSVTGMQANVKMTLTSPGCHLGGQIAGTGAGEVARPGADRRSQCRIGLGPALAPKHDQPGGPEDTGAGGKLNLREFLLNLPGVPDNFRIQDKDDSYYAQYIERPPGE